MVQEHKTLTNSNGSAATRGTRETIPLVDVYENEQELLVLSDLPGVTPDQLSIEVDHTDLKIHGHVPDADPSESALFARQFRLDASIDVGKIAATIRDGVLEVHLPKSEPYRVRRIEVTGT